MSLAYLIFGLVAGVGVSRLQFFYKAQDIVLAWFHWVMLTVWFLLASGILGFVTTSFEEQEPQAASMAILIFGGGLLVLTFLGYRFGFKPTLKKKA
ncbi:MAG: hypothetical protein MI742_14375 [Desulfobacterales bacterium]|nr:hypothetical protein [Desulfobacterales bacterium]